MNEETKNVEEVQTEEVSKSKGLTNWMNKLGKKAKMSIVVCLVFVLSVGGAYFIGTQNGEYKDTIKVASEPKTIVADENGVLTQESVINVLHNSGELTTMKFTQAGVSDFKEENGIYFLNKSKFTMFYKATVRAGVDIKDVKVDVDNEQKKVIIIIPQASIQSVDIDPASIRYFDDKFVLINTDEKEQSAGAQILAQGAAQKEARESGILDHADERAKAIIQGLLSNTIPDDYELIIQEGEIQQQ